MKASLRELVYFRIDYMLGRPGKAKKFSGLKNEKNSLDKVFFIKYE